MTNRYLPGAAESAKASEPMVINVHEGASNENERHGNNPDEVRSESSARSRSKSRSNSGERSRPMSNLGPESRSCSLSRCSFSDKLYNCIGDELVRRATAKILLRKT